MSQMKSRKSPMTDENEDCQWLIKYVNTAKYIYHNWRSCLMWHRNRFIQFWLISKNWQKYPNIKGRKGKNRNAIALISLFFSPKQILRDNWESFWNLHLRCFSSETEPSFKRSQQSLKLAKIPKSAMKRSQSELKHFSSNDLSWSTFIVYLETLTEWLIWGLFYCSNFYHCRKKCISI